jgi:hypothetical protein
MDAPPLGSITAFGVGNNFYPESWKTVLGHAANPPVGSRDGFECKDSCGFVRVRRGSSHETRTPFLAGNGCGGSCMTNSQLRFLRKSSWKISKFESSRNR